MAPKKNVISDLCRLHGFEQSRVNTINKSNLKHLVAQTRQLVVCFTCGLLSFFSMSEDIESDEEEEIEDQEPTGYCYFLASYFSPRLKKRKRTVE